MLTLDDDLLAALEQDHEPGYRASAYYGPTQTLPSVPLTADGRISFDADGQIEARGSAFLARDTDASGSSWVPKSKTDPLAPFGQELSIERTVTVGGRLIGSIPLGRFRITEVPDTAEYFRRFPSKNPANPTNHRDVVVGWACQLELKDRFEQIIADDFIEATGPKGNVSCWSEIRRLSSFPIVQSMPDKLVPTGTTYSSRYEAIKLLAAALGGAPSFTREGALTVRPRDTWITATEPQFVIDGTISLTNGLSNQLYNQVQITSTVGGNDLVAVKKLDDASNPLAVSRPLGGRTFRTSLPLTTQEELNAAAVTTLQRVSTRQAATVSVRCLARPDLELGDFGLVRDPVSGREVLGEVAGMSFSLNPLDPMDLTLVAAETR